MKVSELSKEFELKTGVKLVFQILFILMVFANVLLSVRLATLTNTHRETLVPPTINKTCWVDDQQIDASYLEQMANFLIQLAFNNTPVNAEYNAKTLLKYVGPGSYGKLERYLLANVRELRKNNTSTLFSVRAISVLKEDNAVAFSGVLTTYIADRRVSERSKTFLVRFGFDAGRVYIQDMLEVDPKEPFKHKVDDKDAYELVPEEVNPKQPMEEVIEDSVEATGNPASVTPGSTARTN